MTKNYVGLPTGKWVLDKLEEKDSFTEYEKDKMKEYVEIKKKYRYSPSYDLFKKVRKKLKEKGVDINGL